MLINLLASDAAPAAVEPARWTDIGTAIGTIVLGIAALATIVVSVVITGRDRRAADDRATADRTQALADLKAERVHAKSLQASASAHAELMQVRGRQAVYAANLVGTLDDFQDVLRELPLAGALLHPDARGPHPQIARQAEVRRVVRLLRRAAHTAAVLLGNPEMIRRMERLMLLASAAQELAVEDAWLLSDKNFNDILGYTIFVQLGLEDLVAGREPVPIETAPYYPILGGLGGGYWYPNPVHPSWWNAIDNNPLHPQYKKIVDRRGQ